ncbi:MAG: HAD family hydrolase [Candidatus Altiarchaeota archaeon]|nr:HAD family hydrolase [Candidatus Altiarchaeota archaeon]
MKKAVFLDRDGVINENLKDIVEPSQFHLLHGVSEAIKKLNESNYLVVIITNQPVIAKGFCTFEDMDAIHQKMKNELAKEGAKIDAIYVCPHHPEKGFKGEVPELKIDCDCRKPKPGLILQAITDYSIDVENSWIVGDSETDITAGKTTGLKTILISGKLESAGNADYTFKDLKTAVEHIIIV